jgi:transposase InsO family protein
LGTEYLHVAVDDHSRYAYAEALADERGVTTVGFVERALAHLGTRGVHVQRILTDNGANYRSHVFSQFAAGHGIRLKRTRPYRPQTNGKAEAFNKILQNEWAYLRPYSSNSERLALLPDFLLYYNQARPHGGIGGATPLSRL